MRGNFRTLLRKFCLESSILGLKYFYLYPDWLTRCFWAMVMMLNMALAFILTRLLYNRFAEMPTRITIENQHEALWNLPHPAVTICSPNQISISAMKHFNRTLIDGRNNGYAFNLERTVPLLLGFYQLIEEMNTDELTSLQILMNRNRYTTIEVMKSMAQGCDQFLKLCYFQGEHYPCAELFSPILTRHGLCCIFNSIYKLNTRNEKIKNFQPRLIDAFGIRNSLSIVVDYEPLHAVDKTIVNAGSTRVIVTDWTEFPADDESRMVPPHTESFHIMHATHTYCSEDVKSLSSLSRKCYFEDEQSLPYFGNYHNSDCDLLCFTSHAERRCGCSMIFMPYLKPEKACNVTSIVCIIETKLQMSKWFKMNQCDCPRDCESRRYRLDISVGNLDALPHIIPNLYENVTFTESTSILHLFFPTAVYVKQKEETVMSLITLASNLGGVFGLCLGCSYISICEILFFIYLAIRNHVRDRLRRVLLDSANYYN